MIENRPRSPDRKFALVAPAVIVLVAAVALVVLLIKPPSEPAAPTTPEPAPPRIAAPPAAPVAPAMVSRADFIAGAAAAASAYAAGEDAPGKIGPQIGRAFVVKVAFGCSGPAAAPGPAQAYSQYDPAKHTLRLVARPSIWTELPLVRQALKARPEAVEGFWLPWPWMTSDACPASRDVAPPATPTPVAAPTLGLAMLYGPDSSRIDQRGDRPYEVVLPLAKTDGGMASRTFKLVLEGRVAAFSQGMSVRCWSESTDHRPVCLYAVDIDRVAFEDDQGAALAEWRR